MARPPIPRGIRLLALAATGILLAIAGVSATMVGPLIANPPTVDVNAQPYQGDQQIAPQPQWEQGTEGAGADLTWLPILALALFAIIVLLVIWWVARNLRWPARKVAAPLVAEHRTLHPQILARLTGPADVDLGDGRSFDFTRAADDIVASWKTVESAVADAGFERSAASTPTEFLADGQARLGAIATPQTVAAVTEATQTLLQLYHRARFDTQALTPGAATAARQSAKTLLTAWDTVIRDSGHLSTAPSGAQRQSDAVS